MMTSDFGDLATTYAHSAADGELHADLLLTDPAANDPMVFCRSQATAGVSLLTRAYGIRGYATSVHTACASGGQALGTALKLIRRGAVDCALAGGFDSMISPIGISGFCLLSALSADNATPQRASRPFDATRNGFLLGEGAGFLVLEEWEAARRRGARIYAELAGDGNSLSSYRITDSPPDGDGPIQAMRAALADAGAVGPPSCRSPDRARRPPRRAGRCRLPERARDVDGHERPQRDRRDARRLRRRRDARQRELDQEHDGPPHRGGRRGRGCRVRARRPSRRNADQCESGQSAIPTAI